MYIVLAFACICNSIALIMNTLILLEIRGRRKRERESARRYSRHMAAVDAYIRQNVPNG